MLQCFSDVPVLFLGFWKEQQSANDQFMCAIDSRYTGNSPDTPSMVVLLGALDLAHRWQVPHIVAMAENELVGMATWTGLSEFVQ